MSINTTNDPATKPLLESPAPLASGSLRDLQSEGRTDPHASSSATQIFFDVLNKCNKVAGEENINEFLPYTVLSLSNKAFYSVLFVLYFSNVQDGGGDSANGVTYQNEVINIVNASSVVITGLALMLLSGLSGKNTWNFRRVVHKTSMPLSMRKNILSMNNIRFARLLHTAIASSVNVANGCFQLMQNEAFSREENIVSLGTNLALYTAIPALALVLTKNIFDFLTISLDLTNCQNNIGNLKNIGAHQLDDDALIRFRVATIKHLSQKRRALILNAFSSGLVSSGMSVLFFGTIGKISVRFAVSFFLATAIPGQLIPLIKSLRSKLCKNRISSLETQETKDLFNDKGTLIHSLHQDLVSDGASNTLIRSMQKRVFSLHLNPEVEKINGLEQFAKILF
ncbi:MAG: hypothetical protein P0S96_02595 [Simkaniaceae bacterium]|nr:hypothetical protein [Candidatus Sacchlamyda saccharinae]